MSIPVDSMSRIKDPVSEAMEQLASPTHPVHTLPHPPVDPGSTPTPNPYIIVAVREQARLIAQMRNGVPIAQLENPFTMSDAEYLHFIQTRLLQDPPDMSRYRYDRDVDIVRAMLIAPDENANLDPDTGSSSASAILPSTSDRSLGGSIWATQTAQESKTGKEKAELQPRSPARHQRRQVPLPPSPPLSLNDEQRNKTIRDILVNQGCPVDEATDMLLSQSPAAIFSALPVSLDRSEPAPAPLQGRSYEHLMQRIFQLEDYACRIETQSKHSALACHRAHLLLISCLQRLRSSAAAQKP